MLPTVIFIIISVACICYAGYLLYSLKKSEKRSKNMFRSMDFIIKYVLLCYVHDTDQENVNDVMDQCHKAYKELLEKEEKNNAKK